MKKKKKSKTFPLPFFRLWNCTLGFYVKKKRKKKKKGVIIIKYMPIRLQPTLLFGINHLFLFRDFKALLKILNLIMQSCNFCVQHKLY